VAFVSRRATALAAVLFVALPVGVVLASHHVADALGRALGREASLALGRLPARRAAPPAELLQPAAEETATPAAVSELESGKPGKPAKSAKRRGKAPPPTAERGVFVAAETVLGLASRRVIPRAVPVPASASRPAGLRLVGVAALGIGLRDGDILTHVLGAPAGSVAAVIDAVVRARANSARVISGTFWREGRSLSLVVEQPYLASSAPTPAPP
jgi:S1-C subfamily serine protease